MNKLKTIKEIYDDIQQIDSDVIIEIYNDTIKIQFKYGISTEKILKLDKYFGKQGWIYSFNDGVKVGYSLKGLGE